MSQVSHERQNLSDIIGAATGIGPKANAQQIKHIAATIAERSQETVKIQEKLVNRLQKPRMYGLLCVYKTLHLIVKLLPICHGTFREYWIRNCGLFNKEYLNDTSDQEEIQVCKNITDITNEIKEVLKKLNDGRCLQDTMPPNYITLITSSDNNSRQNNEVERTTNTASLESESSPTEKSTPLRWDPISPSSTRKTHTTDKTKLKKATNFSGKTMSPPSSKDSTPESDDKTGIGLLTPQTSPSSPFRISRLRDLSSPKIPIKSLEGVSQSGVETMSSKGATADHNDSTHRLLTPTSSPLQLNREIYIPKKTVNIRDTPEIIPNLPFINGSDISSSETLSKGIKRTELAIPIPISRNEKQVLPGSSTSQSRLREEVESSSSEISVVLSEHKYSTKDLHRKNLFQESVRDLTDCIQEVDSHIDRGGYANVWKGIWLRSVSGNVEREMVAIKVTRGSDFSTGEAMKKLYQEVHTWQKLSHKNIVPFYGIYTFSEGLHGMVSPFYSKGHVIQFLEQTGADPIKLIHGISKGMEHLHLNGIIHGDIKGANVLVHDDGHACLIDFGLAQTHDEEMMALGQEAFNMETSIRWSPPELLKPVSTNSTKVATKTEKSDIYSFACTVIEMFTLEPPYPRIQDLVRIIRKICSGEHPERPKTWHSSDKLWILVKRCWHGRAEERPTIRQVISELESYAPYLTTPGNSLSLQVLPH